jgi:CheY-like chemotaxis protein
MPVMDGLTMLDKLKSQQVTQHIPVVVITSSEDTVELRRDVFSRGAADFISKPIVPADFVPRIQRFVEG